MRKRLILLLGSFVVFYYLIRVTYNMPNLVHGNWYFDKLPEPFRARGRFIAFMAIREIRDIGFNFLFALIPYWALYRWYPAKKIGYSVLLIVVGLAAVFMLSYWTEPWLYHYNENFLLKRTELFRLPRMKTYFLNSIFYFLIAAIYGTVFYFIRYSRYKELQQKELELQSRQTELSFLRSQINPHFLFNSLNNIYSLVYQGSGQALAAIAGLSDLLRYMLYDATEKVSLQKEIDYIRKYIELQRLRFDHVIKAELRVEGDGPASQIAPLLLVPFVENAFKHGDFRSDGSGLEIRIYSLPEKTYFHCSNRKGKQQKDTGGGIGLENVRRRLSLLYPDRHQLSIMENEESFNVTLELTHGY